MASRSRCHSSATASKRSGAGSGGGASSLSVFADPPALLPFRLKADSTESQETVSEGPLLLEVTTLDRAGHRPRVCFIHTVIQSSFVHSFVSGFNQSFIQSANSAGIMVIQARNPVHSVLFLILVFFNAPFGLLEVKRPLA